jgi:cardiolipin synthase
MSIRSYYLINSLTLYRLLIAPWLLIIALAEQYEMFKWMLVLSFATDAVDGLLARKYKVTTAEGAHLDSIADDATFLAALAGLVLFKPAFLEQQWVIVVVISTLLLIEVVLALYRYGKISSFHTRLAKLAAVLQGMFFISFFFLEEPLYLLFYVAAGVTALQLIEEIVLVLLNANWHANIKGLYWWIRDHKMS